jgi:hypothetical protein
VLLTGAFSESLSLLKVGMLGCVVNGVAPSCWTGFRGVSSRCLSPVLPWCDRLSNADGISEVVQPEGCFVSSCWSLLPTGQVSIELYARSLFSLVPDSPRWSDMFLISPGSSCVTPLPLWLWQVSSSPNKVEQISVLLHPQSQ